MLKAKLFESMATLTREITVAGQAIRVRPMTGIEYDEWARITQDGATTDDHATWRGFAFVVATCVVDATGAPVFSPEEREGLLNLPVSVLAQIGKAGLEVSGLTAQADPSAIAPSTSSGSPSPSDSDQPSGS